jgi:secreted PhoX family phosphatase
MWQVDPVTGESTELVWLGKMSHEGIGFAGDGSIWEGDENHQGAIFRAVPDDPTDLTAGGTLSFLVDGVGFLPVSSPQTAVADAFAGGATLYDRPEDFDQANGRIYFSATEPLDDAIASSTPGHPVHEGGVYSVNDSGVPHVALFAALNDPTTPGTVQGLQYPDNLAIDAKGNVWIHEDIPDGTGVHTKQSRNMQDELWVALPDDNGDGMSDGLYKFANMGNSATATGCQNEWTGGAFTGSGLFFVNQQHADSPTWRVELQHGGALHKS